MTYGFSQYYDKESYVISFRLWIQTSWLPKSLRSTLYPRYMHANWLICLLCIQREYMHSTHNSKSISFSSRRGQYSLSIEAVLSLPVTYGNPNNTCGPPIAINECSYNRSCCDLFTRNADCCVVTDRNPSFEVLVRKLQSCYPIRYTDAIIC